MFLLCCGARERRPRVNNDPAAEQDETTWLIGPDRSTMYTTDIIVNSAARIEADALRDLVRETENKMVNITDPQPFLFRDSLSPVHDLLEDSGPEYTPSSPTVPSPSGTITTPRGPSAPPPTRAPTPIHSPRGTKRPLHGYSSHDGRSMPPSRSMSASSSRTSSGDEDDYSRHPALPRGPILKVRLVPVPKRARRKKPKELDDGEGPAETPAKVAGGVDDDGATEPSGTPVVHALSKEDHDSIMALSNNLWAALERDFRITDSPKVIWTWD